jgi:small subunit ribosomal protein S9
MRVMEPLSITQTQGLYDIDATLDGGGTTGQADALRLGISRGLVELDADLRATLKKAGMLTRDSRVVESKKYGLRKARRAPQYTKR